MNAIFAAALLAAAPAGKGTTPVVRHEGQPAPEVRTLAGPRELAALCGDLTPLERLRTKGDALDRGEAEVRHAGAREEALSSRYEVTVPGGKLAFAPYDGPERRLTLAEPFSLVLGPRAKLWTASERGLPVDVDAAGARRILDAQRAGRLTLAVTFDLPEDATCGAEPRLGTYTLAVDPVDWRWMDGATTLARGGANADRPLVTAAQGARPKVDVGEPIAGPGEAKKAVLAHAAELEACYADALRADPAVDGVLVVEVSQAAKAVIAADSTGAPDLAACVARVLAALPPPATGKAAVPIRFELVAPKVAGAASAPAGGAAVVPAPAAPAAATAPVGR
ncbi:hypothetical protein [Anaeromyxobacter oryzae]|nr:hypothetical protein [Anaeromyxobacter oryzae]